MNKLTAHVGPTLHMLRYLLQRSNWNFYGFLICTLAAAVLPTLTLSLTQMIGNSIQKYLELKVTGPLLYLLVLQALLMVSSSVFNTAGRWFGVHLNTHYKFMLEHDLNTKLSRTKLSVIEETQTQNKLNSVAQMLPELGFIFVQNVFNLVKSLVVIGSLPFVMRGIPWYILAMVFFVGVLNVWIIYKHNREQFKLYMTTAESMRKVDYFSGLLRDRVHIGEVRAFSLLPFILGRWRLHFKSTSDWQVRIVQKQEIMFGLLQVLTQVLQLATLAILVLFSSLTFGVYLLITQSLLQLQNSLHELVHAYGSVSKSAIFIPQFFELQKLEEEDSVKTSDLQTFSGLQHSIQVNNLTYRYPGASSSSLNGVSFTIRRYEKVAIVGHNGSGKSTLLKCMLGLYDNYKGDIYYDGTELRKYRCSSVRERISVLFQQHAKYPVTLRENMTMGTHSDEINLSRLGQAERLSDAAGLADQLPLGHDTVLSPIFGGVDLSGGQWQKVALARAYYKPCDLLILDEPTSAIDPLAEDRLFTGMFEHLREKTAILMTHRLSLCRWVDKVIVMDKGRVVEVGSHDELMRSGGHYKMMFDSQMDWYTKPTAAV